MICVVTRNIWEAHVPTAATDLATLAGNQAACEAVVCWTALARKLGDKAVLVVIERGRVDAAGHASAV